MRTLALGRHEDGLVPLRVEDVERTDELFAPVTELGQDDQYLAAHRDSFCGWPVMHAGRADGGFAADGLGTIVP
jgi:hypothetical protein